MKNTQAQQDFTNQAQKIQTIAAIEQKNKPNHVLHFLVTFFTVGIWSLVWVCLSYRSVGKTRRELMQVGIEYNKTPWISGFLCLMLAFFVIVMVLGTYSAMEQRGWEYTPDNTQVSVSAFETEKANESSKPELVTEPDDDSHQVSSPYESTDPEDEALLSLAGKEYVCHFTDKRVFQKGTTKETKTDVYVHYRFSKDGQTLYTTPQNGKTYKANLIAKKDYYLQYDLNGYKYTITTNGVIVSEESADETLRLVGECSAT